jgi:hypothetical protein
VSPRDTVTGNDVERLVGLINGFQASQAIHVAVWLGLPDLIGPAAKPAAELAAATQTHPTALHRLLRALASIGVFEERDAGCFGLSGVGEWLRSDIAGSHAALALLVGRPHYRQAWGDLLAAVRDGTAGPVARSHDDAQAFDDAMAGDTEQLVRAILAAVDFTHCRHVVDVGCGSNQLLPQILAERPSLRGTMLDRPQIAGRIAASAGLSDRCASVGGDFFVSVPAADVYLLSAVLHEWSDAAATDILRACRRAMDGSARVILIEHVLGSPHSEPVGTFMDLAMLVTNGGRERTREEFAAIIADADLRLTSITPTASHRSIIVAARAAV